MMDAVEVKKFQGVRPRINDGALRVVDYVNHTLYIFGGTPWADNPVQESPTCRPTSDFFKLNLIDEEWTNLTVCGIVSVV